MILYNYIDLSKLESNNLNFLFLNGMILLYRENSKAFTHTHKTVILQDTKSIYRNQLHFDILTINCPKGN